jgi:hypothetical protein
MDQSGRWDSNPWPSPWQGDVLPLNYARSQRWKDTLIESECQDSMLRNMLLSMNHVIKGSIRSA